ncbi:nucleoside/nucleotide kinase family protein [Kineococcus gynurae]|uniref:Mannitol-1-phosphate 5-dehydrogenase n=1 Tax=Kineococcus gynurae TaxID=452979 RepID=A0ABV5LNK4_9ACTN
MTVTPEDLVRRARDLQASGGRRLIGITGAPGAGKSTVCAALADALGDDVVIVGMDGFHLANVELDRLGRRGRKGAPDTFDVAGYVALLRRIRAQQSGTVYAPVFDRGLDEAVAGAQAVPADVALVVTEGNYLLLDDHGWGEVREQLDEVWFLDVDAGERERRLTARRASFGDHGETALAWIRDVDLPNGLRVEQTRERADLVLALRPRLDLTVPGTDPTHPALPAYDRSAVRTGIVHLGVGAFHRAHQAMFFDRVLAAGHPEWGICGVGLLPGDARTRDVLRAQDHLFTSLTLDDAGRSEARVIGSLHRYLFAPDDPEAVLAELAAPGTRIVSLTITEGGYNVDDATGEFRPVDAEVLADLEAAGRGGSWTPRSALGFLTLALQRRRAGGTVPFTVVSCDNLPGNGTFCRSALVGFASRVNPELAAWIAAEVAFPNSMVDRITPATTPEVATVLHDRHGIVDAWPVRSEVFVQWVLEDTFPAGRPPLQDVGVQVVADVEPYELMKLRLLNASHQVMGYLGQLDGAEMVHEVCLDPGFREFLRAWMDREARPTLPPVPGIDLDDYCSTLLARFGNRAIADTLARQVADASDRIPTFVLPVVRDRIAAGVVPPVAALVVAGWSVWLERRWAAGEAVPDRRHDRLVAAIAAEHQTPGGFVAALPEVFADLSTHEGFRAAVARARAELTELGTRGAMAAALAR